MMRIIISGGGTGGHIFPAIAIANALKAMVKDVEILFIGALGKMEMEKVPAAGYKIVGLPVTGFQRRLTWKNLIFPFRLLGSMLKAQSIISGFKPDIVIGVGGYASGPTLRIASSRGIPTLIQEQNSFPGVTNRILSQKVNKICVAYEGMEKFFPPKKIVITGNPIRQNLISQNVNRNDAFSYFKLDPAKKTVLVVGGSLGARTINEAILSFVSSLNQNDITTAGTIQILWQTGKLYYSQIEQQAQSGALLTVIQPFIERMELAYSVADLVVSRAGAIAISELCVVGKPVILIPSPNVAEDHQTKNAKALEVKNAAVLIPDRDAVMLLGKTITTLLGDKQRMATLGANISTLAIHDAANRIAREALQMQGGDKSIKDIPESVYFLGIGGIGMSALARYFASHGATVSGYDRTETPLTDQLQREGMHIHFTEDTGQIPASPGTVIYTPAVPDDHKELVYFREHGVTMKKRAEILGEIARKYKTVAVAGTHGKTTTSTLIAHILHTANTPFLAFLGGISKNYDTNYITNLSEHQPEEVICVVEADEYDKSFLQLSPDIAIITSIDADHLDIYGSYNDLQQTFSAFSKKIKSNGSLILKKGIALETVENNTFSVYGYVVNGDAAFSASNIRLAEGLLNFDFVYPDGTIPNMILNVPGMFNLENAIAALAVGIRLGIDHRMLRKALSTYEGVKRRFEYIIRKPELVYIDDYAHHPEELRAAITATRDLYPGRKVTGIFQPHLFSRTRDLADDFARSLELLDELILMEIYPAREKPIEGITSQLLLDKVNLTAKKIVQKETILEVVSNCNPDVLLTLGAGDIDQFVEPIRNLLTNSEKS